jgi:hypothetical protein
MLIACDELSQEERRVGVVGCQRRIRIEVLQAREDYVYNKVTGDRGYLTFSGSFTGSSSATPCMSAVGRIVKSNCARCAARFSALLRLEDGERKE